MTSLGQLVYELKLDDGSFSTKVESAKGQFDSIGQSASDAAGNVSSIGDNSSSVADKIVGVLAGTAVFASLEKLGEKLVQLATQAASVGDNIDKTSQKLGFSADSYQKWSFIMERSGSSVDGLGRSMNNLTTILTGSGSEKSTEALKELGLTVEDLAGMDTGDAFQSIIRAVMQLDGTSTEKKGILQTLFGGTAKQLMPLVNGGVQGLNELLNTYDNLNLGLSDETVASAAALADSLTNLNTAAETLKTNFGMVIGNTIKPAIDSMASLVGSLNGILFNGDNDSVGEKISGIFNSLAENLTGIDVNEAELQGIIDYLEQLGDFGDLSPEDQQLWLTAAQQLIDKCPELASSFDLETGAIEGGTKALRQNVTAMAQNARQKARMQALEGYYGLVVDANSKLASLDVNKGIAERQNDRLSEKLLADFRSGAYQSSVDSMLWVDQRDVQTADDVVRAYQAMGYMPTGAQAQAYYQYAANKATIDNYDAERQRLEAERDEAVANYETAKATLDQNDVLLDTVKTVQKTVDQGTNGKNGDLSKAGTGTVDTSGIESAIRSSVTGSLGSVTINLDGQKVGQMVSQYLAVGY